MFLRIQISGLSQESAALGLPEISEYLLSGEYIHLQLASKDSFYPRGGGKRRAQFADKSMQRKCVLSCFTHHILEPPGI